MNNTSEADDILRRLLELNVGAVKVAQGTTNMNSRKELLQAAKNQEHYLAKYLLKQDDEPAEDEPAEETALKVISDILIVDDSKKEESNEKQSNSNSSIGVVDDGQIFSCSNLISSTSVSGGSFMNQLKNREEQQMQQKMKLNRAPISSIVQAQKLRKIEDKKPKKVVHQRNESAKQKRARLEKIKHDKNLQSIKEKNERHEKYHSKKKMNIRKQRKKSRNKSGNKKQNRNQNKKQDKNKTVPISSSDTNNNSKSRMSMESDRPRQYEMSDYDSDDDDSDDECMENKPKKFIPEWARKENVWRTAMEQRNVDPETVFGTMENMTCDLDDIFKNFSIDEDRFSKKKRKKSGDWSKDRTTDAEKKRFRKMREQKK